MEWRGPLLADSSKLEGLGVQASHHPTRSITRSLEPWKPCTFKCPEGSYFVLLRQSVSGAKASSAGSWGSLPDLTNVGV